METGTRENCTNRELQTICTKNAIKLKFYGQYYLQFSVIYSHTPKCNRGHRLVPICVRSFLDETVCAETVQSKYSIKVHIGKKSLNFFLKYDNKKNILHYSYIDLRRLK